MDFDGFGIVGVEENFLPFTYFVTTLNALISIHYFCIQEGLTDCTVSAHRRDHEGGTTILSTN